MWKRGLAIRRFCASRSFPLRSSSRPFLASARLSDGALLSSVRRWLSSGSPPVARRMQYSSDGGNEDYLAEESGAIALRRMKATDDDEDYRYLVDAYFLWLSSFDDNVAELNEDSDLQPTSIDSSIEAIEGGSSIIVIEKKDRAFLLVFPDSLGLRDIVDTELSGVTERIEYTFNLKHVGHTTVEAHQTYDVWLVAEFVELVSKSLPHVPVVISDAAEASIDSRWQEKEQRRSLIPEVEAARHPETRLHPHQNEAVRFFMENKGRGLLAFDMGLGKTRSTIAYVAGTQKRALVVAPKRVVDHWISEAEEAFPGYFLGRTVKLGAHIKPNELDGLKGELEETRLACVNYESLERFFPLIKSAALDTIILDESHYIKNPKAKRTKFLLKQKDSFKHRLLLSGTPIKNRVEEFVSQLDFLGVGSIGRVEEMSAGKLWNMLQKRKLYLKRALVSEFPILSFKDPEIVGVEDIPTSLDDDFYSSFQTVEEGSDCAIAVMQRELTKTAMAKAPATAELVAQKLLHETPDDKVIVFTERIACAESIFEDIESQSPDAGVLLHYGQLADQERKSILEEFQDPGSGKRVLVSTRQSLAVGVNLPCANKVVFNDLAWSPADILQAAARVKRLNQQKEVFEYWTVAKNDFDTNLMEALQVKRRLIQRYSEGKNISEEDQEWMHKSVSYLEILYGVGYRPRKKSHKKRR